KLPAHRDLRAIAAAIKRKGRAPALGAVAGNGERQGLTQLLEVLRIAKSRVFVEPLGGQAFGGDTDAPASALELDRGADHGLGCLRHGDDAKPKRQSPLDVAVEALEHRQSPLYHC